MAGSSGREERGDSRIVSRGATDFYLKYDFETVVGNICRAGGTADSTMRACVKGEMGRLPGGRAVENTELNCSCVPRLGQCAFGTC